MRIQEQCRLYLGGWTATAMSVLPLAAACARGPELPAYSAEIGSYVDFLTDQQPAVEYVLGLFDSADIVVLCERFHPETTQYDFVLSLLADPRFQERVGHVFTEIGSSSLDTLVAELMSAEALEPDEVDVRRQYIYRNFTHRPIWGASNYYDLLGGMYAINRELPPDRRIALHPSDIPFRWEDMTPEAWAAFEAGPLRERDQIMADQIATRIHEFRGHGDARPKALVIMNFRHAFPNLELRMGERVRLMENTTGFLMAAFPGQVRNVLLNTVIVGLAASDRDATISPMQGGKWDAAFEVTGNKAVGFDFAGSPFGDDPFDMFPIGVEHLTYQDVFTGFVFYQPLRRHRMAHGVPGVIDSAFTEELVHRLLLVGDFESERAALDSAAALSVRSESGYERFPSDAPLEQLIERWLVPVRDSSNSGTT